MQDLTVPESIDGERLDRFLARVLGRSRNQVQRWITEGRVTVEGTPCSASTLVRAGQQVHYSAPGASVEHELEPEPGTLDVLHEDADLVVINKPAGLVVHPGAGRPTGTLVHRLLSRFPEIAAVGHPRRPGIVHRLDRDTSGVMVIARNETAYQELTRAFAERRVLKLYVAISFGATARYLLLEGAIGRHRTDRKRMTVRTDGRAARTEARRVALAPGGVASLLQLQLHTGRTHQIRVHLKQAGHPLVGDPAYGEARWRGIRGPARLALEHFPRPALHAWQLSLEHPAQGQRMRWIAPPPVDLQALWHDVVQDETGGPLQPELEVLLESSRARSDDAAP